MGRLVLGLCSICLRYVDPRARFCSTCRVRVDRERRNKAGACKPTFGKYTRSRARAQKGIT